MNASQRVEHSFGGPWTEKKLAVLRKYLSAYQQIFKKNPKAKYYETVYIDAFAGTGDRKPRTNDGNVRLLDEMRDEEAALKKGSARVALELPMPFDRYVFIEKRKDFIRELKGMVHEEFPALYPRCTIERGDCNLSLAHWCQEQHWSSTRAVAFLDPYRMTVEWPLIETLGRTRGVDLWVLVPVGVGVARLLTKGRMPGEVWAKRLDRFFGTPAWRTAFYQQRIEPDFFEQQVERIEKVASIQAISTFFNERLATVFPYVAPQPGRLMNSRHSLLFLLHFASHNATGLRIANDILKRW